MKNQIEKTLPRSAWKNIVISENNEPLVEIIETEKIKLGLIKKSYPVSFLIRKTIKEKLEQSSERLPDGIVFVVIEAHRSLEAQQEEWDRIFSQIKGENTSLSDEEVEQQVRLLVAKPAPLANHNCGGALDITLAFENGNLLDMGTPYISEATIEDKKKFQMFSEEITKDQKENRKILRDALETEDFVWYPGEWWHYCWGDRMWAVYSNQTECFYGPAPLG